MHGQVRWTEMSAGVSRHFFSSLLVNLLNGITGLLQALLVFKASKPILFCTHPWSACSNPATVCPYAPVNYYGSSFGMVTRATRDVHYPA